MLDSLFFLLQNSRDCATWKLSILLRKSATKLIGSFCSPLFSLHSLVRPDPGGKNVMAGGRGAETVVKGPGLHSSITSLDLKLIDYLYEMTNRARYAMGYTYADERNETPPTEDTPLTLQHPTSW